MGFKKYLSDYKLENVPNKKGKLVTRAFYKGDYFVYKYSGEVLKKARVMTSALSFAAMAAFVIGVAFYRNTGFTSQYYTLMPFALCFFPLLYLGMAVYGIIKTGEGAKVDREHKDGIYDRVSKCLLGLVILDGANLIGIFTACILKITGGETRGVTPYDIVYVCASLVIMGAAAAAFSPRKKLEMEKTV